MTKFSASLFRGWARASGRYGHWCVLARCAWPGKTCYNEKFATETGWEQMCANYAYFYTHNLSDIKYDIK